jgi:hypothetical protein
VCETWKGSVSRVLFWRRREPFCRLLDPGIVGWEIELISGTAWEIEPGKAELLRLVSISEMTVNLSAHSGVRIRNHLLKGCPGYLGAGLSSRTSKTD